MWQVETRQLKSKDSDPTRCLRMGHTTPHSTWWWDCPREWPDPMLHHAFDASRHMAGREPSDLEWCAPFYLFTVSQLHHGKQVGSVPKRLVASRVEEAPPTPLPLSIMWKHMCFPSMHLRVRDGQAYPCPWVWNKPQQDVWLGALSAPLTLWNTKQIRSVKHRWRSISPTDKSVSVRMPIVIAFT
jgi:hypothetical protein